MPAQTQQPNPTSSSRKPRIMRSKATWQHIINQYNSSSLTQADFCREHDIAPMSFYKWRQRLSKENQNDHFIDISQSMVSVKPIEQKASGTTEPSPWQVELELGQGMTLRIRTV
jgi:transposase-like protein